MPTLKVLRNFNLLRDDGTVRYFAQGMHAFLPTDPDLDHWYVRANSHPVDDGAPAPVKTEAEKAAAAQAAEVARAAAQAQSFAQQATGRAPPGPDPTAKAANTPAPAKT